MGFSWCENEYVYLCVYWWEEQCPLRTGEQILIQRLEQKCKCKTIMAWRTPMTLGVEKWDRLYLWEGTFKKCKNNTSWDKEYKENCSVVSKWEKKREFKYTNQKLVAVPVNVFPHTNSPCASYSLNLEAAQALIGISFA